MGNVRESRGCVLFTTRGTGNSRPFELAQQQRLA